MGNPIQYLNTDNPSQIQGWVSHNKGGFRKTAFIVMAQGGLMKTFHRAWRAFVKWRIYIVKIFTRPHLRRGPNSFNFMQFLGIFGKIVCWRLPLEG